LTPPRRARRRIAGLVIPLRVSEVGRGRCSRNALDVVSEDLPVSLGSALAESLAACTSAPWTHARSRDSPFPRPDIVVDGSVVVG